jgi:zinc protease
VTTTLDYSRFSFLFLDEYLDKALEALSLIILQPALADKEVDTLKRTRFYDMWQEQRDPEFVGRRQLLRVLFKDHPYEKGLFSLDGMKSFNKSINRKDALAFYQRYYRPNNAFLVLAGNLNLTAASRKVSHYFSTWEPKDVDRPLLPSPEPNGEDKVCFVDFPRAKDASLVVGNVIFPYDAPDFFPFLVLNQVLGGTPNSRLFMNLRESKEFAYFAFSEMELFRGSGVYEVRARVVPSACQAAVREILRELDRAAREKVTTFEIEQAKSYLIGNFPMQLNRLDSLAQRVSEIVAFSLGDAYWSQFYDSIMLVDTDRVFEVGQKYLLARPVVIIVGDKATMVEYLRDFPKVDVYDTNGVLLYTMLKGVEE